MGLGLSRRFARRELPSGPSCKSIAGPYGMFFFSLSPPDGRLGNLFGLFCPRLRSRKACPEPRRQPSPTQAVYLIRRCLRVGGGRSHPTGCLSLDSKRSPALGQGKVRFDRAPGLWIIGMDHVSFHWRAGGFSTLSGQRLAQLLGILTGLVPFAGLTWEHCPKSSECHRFWALLRESVACLHISEFGRSLGSPMHAV